MAEQPKSIVGFFAKLSTALLAFCVPFIYIVAKELYPIIYGSPAPFANPTYTFVALATIAITIILFTVYADFRSNSWEFLCSAYKHMVLFLTGNKRIAEAVTRIEKLANTNIVASYSAQFFLLDRARDRNQPFHIFFTHKELSDPDDNKGDTDCRHAKKHPKSLIPMFDDETHFIMRTWYYVFSVLRWENVKIKCACDTYKVDTLIVDKHDKRLKGNLILIGSSKCNPLTEMLLEEYKGIVCKFAKVTSEKTVGDELVSDIGDYEIICTKDGSSVPYTPTPRETAEKRAATGGQKSLDYALITRMKNPLNPEAYVFVFGGCKAAGQLALERFFFDPDVLAVLCKQNHQDGPLLQVVIKTHYDYNEEKGPKLADAEVVYTTVPFDKTKWILIDQSSPQQEEKQ